MGVRSGCVPSLPHRTLIFPLQRSPLHINFLFFLPSKGWAPSSTLLLRGLLPRRSAKEEAHAECCRSHYGQGQHASRRAVAGSSRTTRSGGGPRLGLTGNGGCGSRGRNNRSTQFFVEFREIFLRRHGRLNTLHQSTRRRNIVVNVGVLHCCKIFKVLFRLQVRRGGRVELLYVRVGRRRSGLADVNVDVGRLLELLRAPTLRWGKSRC